MAFEERATKMLSSASRQGGNFVLEGRESAGWTWVGYGSQESGNTSIVNPFGPYILRSATMALKKVAEIECSSRMQSLERCRYFSLVTKCVFFIRV